MTWIKRQLSNQSQQLASSQECSVDFKRPTPENETLFQAFEWHIQSLPPPPNESHSSKSHYTRLCRVLPDLVDLGISSIWLPPGCKANNPQGNGYDCYDLWDLGEFDQKFARSTRWGSREELEDLFQQARGLRDGKGVQIIWDTILNHKTAGDSVEEDIWAVEVHGADRRVETCAPKKINAWLRYDFPGRARDGMKYSDFHWNSKHFNGTDWDQKAEKHAIYKLIDEPASCPKPEAKQQHSFRRLSRIPHKLVSTPPSKRPGKGWAEDVDDMYGNFDFLMFSNIDHSHPAVRTDLLNWADWMIWETGVDGFRLDAAKHYSSAFTKEWIDRVQIARKNRDLSPALIIGEVWSPDFRRIIKWLDAVGPNVFAYDSPLVYNFSRISEDVRTKSKNADLRTILQDTLLVKRPEAALTLVTNHDTQAGQSSFVPMDSGLKSLFYAFILLRHEGRPCVFWGDMYGTSGPFAEPPACSVTLPSSKEHRVSNSDARSLLPSLVLARKLFAYGPQNDYFDSMSCIGFTRAGTHDRPYGCVVVMSISPARNTKGKVSLAIKRMRAGQEGEIWVDLLGSGQQVEIDEKSEGLFTCQGGEVCVFVKKDAPGFEKFPVDFDHTQT
ncbi:Hypothetical protein R9X50_00629900 [Acrodontium crateriforme]|uniref:Glycosyl hydrolase family 13 catalytic domain-containing protein n=1 Tax=Acrodontium crateriforme TaxID=150365 RepID=A0AAQ3R9S1_9PEZI|nr:Hypothetical protein R9X50_00629900 [Acrodontium crateriforme]